jgi:hypothetical protein
MMTPQTTQSKFDKITLELRSKNSSLTTRKSFEGEFLINEDDNLRAEQEDSSGRQWCQGIVYQLMRTKKGAIVVYYGDDEEAQMAVYDDFDDIVAEEDLYAPNVIAAFADALGNHTYSIELDI